MRPEGCGNGPEGGDEKTRQRSPAASSRCGRSPQDVRHNENPRRSRSPTPGVPLLQRKSPLAAPISDDDGAQCGELQQLLRLCRSGANWSSSWALPPVSRLRERRILKPVKAVRQPAVAELAPHCCRYGPSWAVCRVTCLAPGPGQESAGARTPCARARSSAIRGEPGPWRNTLDPRRPRALARVRKRRKRGCSGRAPLLAMG